MNTRSVCKQNICDKRLFDRELDILVLTETWLSLGYDVHLNELTPREYTSVIGNRPQRRGKDNIYVKTIPTGRNMSLEYLQIHLTVEDKIFDLLSIINYRPSPSRENKCSDKMCIEEIKYFLLSRCLISVGKLMTVDDFKFRTES